MTYRLTGEGRSERERERVRRKRAEKGTRVLGRASENGPIRTARVRGREEQEVLLVKNPGEEAGVDTNTEQEQGVVQGRATRVCARTQMVLLQSIRPRKRAPIAPFCR
jgi:hypothetical protein